MKKEIKKPTEKKKPAETKKEELADGKLDKVSDRRWWMYERPWDVPPPGTEGAEGQDSQAQ